MLTSLKERFLTFATAWKEGGGPEYPKHIKVKSKLEDGHVRTFNFVQEEMGIPAELRSIMTTLKGVKDGESEYFYKSKFRKIFENGELRKSSLYTEDDKLSQEVEYNGSHFTIRNYRDDETLQSEYTYLNDGSYLADGPFGHYGKDGALEKAGFHVRGSQEGIFHYPFDKCDGNFVLYRNNEIFVTRDGVTTLNASSEEILADRIEEEMEAMIAHDEYPDYDLYSDLAYYRDGLRGRLADPSHIHDQPTL